MAKRYVNEQDRRATGDNPTATRPRPGERCRRCHRGRDPLTGATLHTYGCLFATRPADGEGGAMSGRVDHGEQCDDHECFCADPDYPDPMCECGQPGWACCCEDDHDQA